MAVVNEARQGGVALLVCEEGEEGRWGGGGGGGLFSFGEGRSNFW